MGEKVGGVDGSRLNGGKTIYSVPPAELPRFFSTLQIHCRNTGLDKTANLTELYRGKIGMGQTATASSSAPGRAVVYGILEIVSWQYTLFQRGRMRPWRKLSEFPGFLTFSEETDFGS